MTTQGPRSLFLSITFIFAISAVAAATCTPGTTNRTVTICSPANNATVSSPVTISAAATDSNPVEAMQVYLDGVKVFEVTNTKTLDTSLAVSSGAHRLTVQAIDASGAFKSTVNITVSGSGSGCTASSTSPSVTICSPANNSTVSSPVSVVAVTTDSNAISYMQIFVDGTAVYTVKASSINTNVSMSSGAHRVTVQAKDSAGVFFKSTVSITVSGTTGSCTPSSTSPSVTICSPANNSTDTSPVHIVAETTDTNSISYMQIYLDHVLVYTVKASSIDTNLSMSAGAHRITAQAKDSAGTIFNSTVNITVSSSSPPPPSGTVSVLTYKNGNDRVGANLQETVLTPSNVNASSFGKKYSYTVDGNVFGEPLYVPNVTINGVSHNVLIVATEHDSVYAFDADGTTLSPLWHQTFLDAGQNITSVPNCTNCGRTALGSEVGVTGTPVIDPTAGIIYVSAMTSNNGTIEHRLHALDLATGDEKFGSSRLITASVPGTGAGNNGAGQVPFDASTANQRPGLLLVNGVVYVSWAAFSDIEPYHGWIMGYDASNLNQVAVFNDSANSSAAGFWEGGCGLSADSNGNIYAMSGNGHYSATANEWGQTFLKLKLGANGLQVVDWFTPFNWSTINSNDLDIGAGGAALLPDSAGTTAHPHLLVAGTKDGKIYLIDRDNMGKFNSTSNSQIVQVIDLNPASVTSGTRPRMYSSPTYWNGFVYFAPANTSMKAFKLQNGQMTLSSTSAHAFSGRGGVPVISANGSTNGIVWVAERNMSTGAGTLRAYNATNLGTELYDSNQNSTRDAMGNTFSFVTPLVVNGKVYVSAKGKIDVYGLLK